MCCYKPNAETNIAVDAGPKDLGSFLYQKQKNGLFKPRSFASRVLTDVESWYSQTEKGALAVTWAFQNYHYYIHDWHATVYTDHKPLERLLTTSPTPPPRIQRWVMRLQAIQLDIDQEMKMQQAYHRYGLHNEHLKKIQENSTFIT